MLVDRMFLHTKKFDSQWAEIGCTDEDLTELQKNICDDPQKAPVISGTGGVRKIRIAREGGGKSGGVRVLYVDFPTQGIVALLYVYPKNAKENIDNKERKILKMMIEQINKNWREK